MKKYEDSYAKFYQKEKYDKVKTVQQYPRYDDQLLNKSIEQKVEDIYWKKLAPEFWKREVIRDLPLRFILSCPECDKVLDHATRSEVMDSLESVVLKGMSKMDKHNQEEHKAIPEA